MRNIKVIFSQADKKLAEKLCYRHEKTSDRYLGLVIFFKTITELALGFMFAFIAGAAVKMSSYYIAAAIISLIFATILFLTSFIFQTIHDGYFVKSLHYQFMSDRMQEILKYEDSLAFSVSKTCSDTVTYNLPDGRCRYIETVNDIPADGDVIITIKEDTDAKDRISLDWYAKII